MKTAIIIFTGLPGTGKTSLSRKIANDLGIELLSKDDLKEIMFDEIGWSDKEFSKKLANACYGIMDVITEQNLKNGHSIILESNYYPKVVSEKFRNLRAKYDCRVIQIVCQTDVDVLAKRYFDRQSSNRHPGHLDNGSELSYKMDFERRVADFQDQPIDVAGPKLIVDTTDFEKVNYEQILNWLKNEI